ncbi:MAG: ABC transporter ATP-binding protein [Betaproteobacteria bacterium]|nr:ABC transporter ATP-binding protein [Betaproteobacteria bacterium]
MIEIENVTKEYPSPEGLRLRILDSINANIPLGSQLGVVGRSGSGKTTLLSMLAGLERPSLGTIRINGFPVSSAGEAELSRFRAREVGFVYQTFQLLKHLSALENVLVAAEIAGHPNARTAAQDALEWVGLSTRLKHRPDQLSGGEQQRVAIARAIVNKPKLLLCDEPTGNLDPQSADQIFRLISSLSLELGATLFFVTHDYALAHQLTGRIELERGQLSRLQLSSGSMA